MRRKGSIWKQRDRNRKKKNANVMNFWPIRAPRYVNYYTAILTGRVNFLN